MTTNNTTPQTATNAPAVESTPAGAGTTTEKIAPVTNLRDAKREQAAARKQAAKDSHPASTEKSATAAKSAPTTKTDATKKEVPPAKKAAPAAGEKLRWAKVDDSDAAVALTADGSYSLLPRDGQWVVELKKGSKVTVLVAGISRSTAYKVAVTHFKTGEVPAVKARKATA